MFLTKISVPFYGCLDLSISITNKNLIPLFVKALSVTLFLSAVWVLGKVIIQIMQPPLEILQPRLQKDIASASNTTLIAAKPSYLLGKPQAAPIATKKEATKPELEDIETLQKTKLNIKLTGILYTPEDSVAVIEENRKTFVLRTAEELRPDIVIEQIEPNFVVLNNRGKLEKLALKESDLTNSAASSQSIARVMSRAERDKLAKIRSDVRKTPLAMNRYVRFRTLNRDGKPYALQVWPRRERALFESLGFKNGDKILAVDGVAVGEMLNNDPRQLQRLMQRTQFNLQIERRGQIQNLSVSL